MKTALVTGCSSGIGLATAVEFARGGIFTFATMRDLSKAGELELLIKNENLPMKIIKLDVTDEKSVDDCLAAIAADRGGLDILVNNAGVMIMGSFEDVSTEDFDLQFKTDFLGPVMLMRKTVRIMMKQQKDNDGIRGHIVNISSIAGKIPFKFSSAYVASKFALEGISESISDEIRSFGIKVTIIEPGVVKTKFWQNMKFTTKENSLYEKELDNWFSLGRTLFEKTPVMPQDVASKVLASTRDSSTPLRVVVGDDAQFFLDKYAKDAAEPEKFKSWFENQLKELIGQG